MVKIGSWIKKLHFYPKELIKERERERENESLHGLCLLNLHINLKPPYRTFEYVLIWKCTLIPRQQGRMQIQTDIVTWRADFAHPEKSN